MMDLRFIKYFSCFQCLLLMSIVQFSTAQTQNTGGTNPIFKNAFTADPSPMEYNGRLYVYVGHDEAKDGEMFTMTGWLCYSTTDMKSWTDHGTIMTPTDFSWGDKDAWAAQVVPKDGKFYLYVTVTGKNPYGGRNIGVAVSDSPTGPFKDAKGTPLVRDNMTNNGKVWDDIDPTVMIDDDGQAYLSWGNPICYLAKLKPNMIEIDGAIQQITPPNYAEGPWLYKRNSLYYLAYPAFVPGVGSEQLCYATATNVNGPWTYRGVLTGAAKNSYTIHPGIIEYKGQSYLFYHNATLTLNGQGPALGRRSVCVEYLCYNADGTIKPITQTTSGISIASPCPPANVPVVSITSPVNNEAFVSPASVTINATASKTGGTISKVEFYNGTTKLGEDLTSPYSYTWTNVAKGLYSITAVATDNSGNKTTSTAAMITVNVPQGPYNGTWNLIPGTIQAENYDVGGNGSAYSDGSAGNTGGATFRTDEDVDLEVCTDAGAGYNIGYATAGEWLEYSVDVQKLGLYDISFRVAANGDARTLSLSMDDKAIATNVAIPNTAGWQAWQTVTVKNVTLKPGKQILRLTIGATDYVNINYVTFTLVKEIKQEPYKGTAHQIPGRIEAEEYDLGGEGLAYHEGNTSGNQGLATLRNDEVDIETTGDVDGVYNLGYTLTGEWLEYTVDVSKTGKYDLDLRLAKDGDGGLMHIEMDGVNVTGAINVPNTGGWQTWQTKKLTGINLSAGEHIMRIVFDSDYSNLNYIEFKGLVTGISSEQMDNIVIYPNPSPGVFSLSRNCNAGCKQEYILITDITGKQIHTLSITNNSSLITVDLSNYSNGIYFIQINSNNYRVVKTSF
jgi:hypothetical protein